MTAPSTATTEGLYGNASTEDTVSKSLTDRIESALSADGSCVQVAVRIRPMLPFEAGTTQCVEALSSNVANGALTIVRLGGAMGPKFTFDEVFPISSSQLDVFEHRVAPLVANLLEGYNATILAYGQTGSGKTHTIMGPSLSNVADAVQDEVQAGVIPRAIRSIFYKLEETRKESLLNSKRVAIYSRNDDDYGDNDDSPEDSSTTPSTLFQYEVRVQFLEVYGEEIRDLLIPHKPTTKLTIRDVGMDEPEVLGATQNKVESAEEALLCLTRGLFRRVTGSTNMNESSSRSHAILSLVVEQSMVVNDDDVENDTAENGSRGNSVFATTTSKSSSKKTSKMHQHVQAKVSKFNFVDLAGAERQKRTGAEGKRLKEGIDINKGLLVLGNVISALGDPKKKGKAFVPYRESKLTRLLRGSLGGNHKTLMMACVSPSSSNMEESLNCLRYANRAKNIQNHAVVNVDATSRLIDDLRGKVQILASDLLKIQQQRGGAGDRSSALETQTTFSIEVLKSLASGGEWYHHAGSHAPLSFPANFESSPSTVMTPSFLSPLQGESPPGNEGQPQLGMPSPSLYGGRLLRHSVAGQERYDENLHALSAENEALRLQLQAVTPGSSREGETPSHPSSAKALEQAFVARATGYEREIAELKARLVYSGSDGRLSSRSDHERTINHNIYNRVDERPFLPNLPPRTPNRRGRSDSSTSSHTNRAESPELSRLRAQVFGSMSQSNNLDAEVEAEEKAFEALTRKFLDDDQSTANNNDSLTLCDDPHRSSVDHIIEAEKMSTGDGEQTMLEYGGRSHLQIEADLFELSDSIFAKEELIQQLQMSQEKYEVRWKHGTSICVAAFSFQKVK
jgi:hypothetical protein